ncbi:NAD-dependent epimerase/dehydratase family protein [Prochlorococcus marinus]|uniref:UDP-glucose 4-epimerase n=1 Tax=Prochlorococcus marinus XMU1408 TaxID=2213228 RepID=A0A318R5T0_PROMR|nr:NAD-dependent epimerase/dehydratase family protein [Prochlorococcus marinus]MBW3041801.1 3-beta hydroxysteroid dehydrogenase [Prochlorococcus marinus str. XMU1408]PYE02942.1 3-beta hydroxysteroid dehydrogenase [Prochlorococcus marinus XMU1408]
MKVLFFGGTRFVGKALVSRLLSKGHEIFVFTRGNLPVPNNVTHLKGDRSSDEDLRKISGHSFDLIVDSCGRKLEDTQRLLEFSGLPSYRFIYISSAGVYNNTQLFPVGEDCPIDPKSRHIGKAKTEAWLKEEAIPFTSFRPTYIYGPGNYNPIEKWFFDRIINRRFIPVPLDGQIITQLGHVSDLAEAISKSLETDQAINQIYNCSGTRAVTFRGLIETAILATGNKVSDFNLRSFDPSKLDPKARKVFPLRLSNFFTDISKIQKDLSWEPKFDLLNGLIDSYKNDYILANHEQPDFTSDESLFD